MKLIITGSRLLQEVQHEFNAAYPFLKMEFFRPVNGQPVAASASNLLQHSLKINDARRVQKDGAIEIADTTRVWELEKELKEKYGLHVQIFRKSGNIWLETIMSDDWTLKQQNDHGREISDYSMPPANDKPDYYIQ